MKTYILDGRFLARLNHRGIFTCIICNLKFRKGQAIESHRTTRNGVKIKHQKCAAKFRDSGARFA